MLSFDMAAARHPSGRFFVPSCGEALRSSVVSLWIVDQRHADGKILSTRISGWEAGCLEALEMQGEKVIRIKNSGKKNKANEQQL